MKKTISFKAFGMSVELSAKITPIFKKHTLNVLQVVKLEKNGQSLVNSIFDTADVKTADDACKIRDAYNAHLKASVSKEDAAKAIAKFNTRMKRYLDAKNIKAKANTGSRAGKTKAGKVTKVTKKAAATQARRTAMEADSKAFVASMAKPQAAPVLHDMASLLAAISAITEKASKADCVAMRDRIVNQFATIINSKK